MDFRPPASAERVQRDRLYLRVIVRFSIMRIMLGSVRMRWNRKIPLGRLLKKCPVGEVIKRKLFSFDEESIFLVRYRSFWWRSYLFDKISKLSWKEDPIRRDCKNKFKRISINLWEVYTIYTVTVFYQWRNGQEWNGIDSFLNVLFRCMQLYPACTWLRLTIQSAYAHTPDIA